MSPPTGTRQKLPLHTRSAADTLAQLSAADTYFRIQNHQLSQFTELCSQQQWSCTACTHAYPSHEACERHARPYCMSAEAKVLNYSTSCDRNSRSSLQTSQTSRRLPGSSAWKAQSELQNWVCWRQRNEVEPAWIWIYDSRDPEWTKRPKLSFPSSIKAPDVSESKQRSSVLTQNGTAKARWALTKIMFRLSDQQEKKKKKRDQLSGMPGCENWTVAYFSRRKAEKLSGDTFGKHGFQERASQASRNTQRTTLHSSFTSYKPQEGQLLGKAPWAGCESSSTFLKSRIHFSLTTLCYIGRGTKRSNPWR